MPRIWRLLTLIFALLLLLVGGWGYVQQQKAARAAQKASEAEKAALKGIGLVTSSEASTAALRRRISELEGQLSRIRQEAPTAKVREVVKWRTREVTIPCGDQIMIPTEPPANDPGLYRPAPPVENRTGSGIKLRFEGLDARVETDAGTRVAVGDLAIYRTYPGPEQRIGIVPWKVTLHESARRELPSSRWLLGVGAGITKNGAAVGFLVQPPPLHFMRARIRPFAFAGLGSSPSAYVGLSF